GAALLGPRFHGPHGKGAGMMGGMMGPRHHLMQEQLATLSPETRGKVEDIWRTHHRALRGSFREMRKARRALTQALTADSYDPQIVADAMADMDEALATPRRHLAEAVLQSAAVMTDEERKAFFEQGLKGRGHKPHGHKPHHGPPPHDGTAPPQP
ncbi:MAG: periplasmic heavy metal sensor, partial [Alphaproteobacteria bacterium]